MATARSRSSTAAPTSDGVARRPGRLLPFYSGYAHERGHGEGEGFNLNLPLPHGSGNDPFLRALDTALTALAGHAPQALVLALGFDTWTIPSACCAWTSMRTATSARVSAPWDCPPWWCRKAATWSRPSGRRWTPSCKAWAGAERRDASSRPLRGPVSPAAGAPPRAPACCCSSPRWSPSPPSTPAPSGCWNTIPRPSCVVRYVAVATLALFLLWRAGRPRLRDAPYKAAGAARPDAGHRRHLLHDGADLDAAVRSHRHLFHVAADHGGAVALAAGRAGARGAMGRRRRRLRRHAADRAARRRPALAGHAADGGVGGELRGVPGADAQARRPGAGAGAVCPPPSSA